MLKKCICAEPEIPERHVALLTVTDFLRLLLLGAKFYHQPPKDQIYRGCNMELDS